MNEEALLRDWVQPPDHRPSDRIESVEQIPRLIQQAITQNTAAPASHGILYLFQERLVCCGLSTKIPRAFIIDYLTPGQRAHGLTAKHWSALEMSVILRMKGDQPLCPNSKP